MSNPKLLTVIKTLTAKREQYLKKYGKEPVIWMSQNEDEKLFVQLCDKVKNTGNGLYQLTGEDKMNFFVDVGMF